MSRLRSHVCAFAACVALGACSLDSRDLAAFQHSAAGPEKLRAILLSPDRTGPLRAEAALKLLDLPRDDVDGRALLFSELHRLDAAGKRAILPEFKEGLSRRMQTPRGEPPSVSAIRAKDAGTKVLALLEPSERALLGSELLRFVAEDAPHRADVGELTLEQIADSIGPSSAKTLVDELNARLDPASLARVARVIDAHADAEQRAQAAARLVELERAYRMSAGDDSTQRERALDQHFLPSLGRFVDQPALRARLLDVASSDAIQPSQRRAALELLAGRCGEPELGRLLALAENEAAPAELRVLALSRVGEVGSKKALPVLLVLLADRKNHALRRRAGELSLLLGGPEAIASFFRSLPTGWGMTYGKAEIDAYSDQLVKLRADNALLLLLGQKLHSSFWWNRVMALHYFAGRGTAEDVWRIRQHVHDLQPIYGAGYPAGHTVGLEAEAALAVATQRLHQNGSLRAWPRPVAAEADAGVSGAAAPTMPSNRGGWPGRDAGAAWLGRDAGVGAAPAPAAPHAPSAPAAQKPAAPPVGVPSVEQLGEAAQ